MTGIRRSLFSLCLFMSIHVFIYTLKIDIFGAKTAHHYPMSGKAPGIQNPDTLTF